MPRFRPNSETVEQLKERVRRLFDDSPLRSLAPLMEETITAVASTAHHTGAGGTQALLKLIDYYERVFLKGFGPRFDLDAWFASDLCTRWSTPARALPHPIIPLYGDQWGYSLLPFPWAARNPQPIYVVCFPGRSEVADLNLLDYPWLCHELGHHFFSQNGAEFALNFRRVVEDFAKALLRKGAADSPSLRAKTGGLVHRLKELWTPRTNTRDWAHEIAADTIALWTCGPAFLSAMQHVLESERIQPYEISETHPPYELRLRIMLDLAENLEWVSYCSELRAILRKWQAHDPVPDANQYAAIAERSLAEECSSQGVRTCRSWDLPLCTPEILREVQQKAANGKDPETATEYLLGAWSIHHSDPNASQSWESNALASLASQLHGNS